eukprot:CAMPEP_0194139644 /NCGR_PEP_ID=MMETSP0152-20130528/9261_1 /TAXON_ID=1049557 /ORGANISM="Thalassiothrix antarctica, Strain L6-D1" /LENGTH=677 /DNA_ID=CAMNT_0038837567 /DNA_START=383 /DNA_END=2416 /DNA_ORIENTATION=-
MEAHMEDLQAIVDNDASASFENVFATYDRAGSLMNKVTAVFSNMCSSLNTDELQSVQREMAPILSRHQSETYQIPGLFTKIEEIHQKRESLQLTQEQKRLVERIYLDFTRSGAALDKEKQSELTDLNAELATLTTSFTQNVMKDEEEYELVLTKDDMVGCPDFLLEAARTAASERNHNSKLDDNDDGEKYVITLSRSLVEPFLTYSDRRDLRKVAWNAWIRRGEMNLPERDNLKIAIQILKTRQKIAKIHGYESFAHYQCADRMAGTPEKVMELLENVWNRAKKTANQERKEMELFLDESNVELEEGIQPYDWRYYAEKVRKAKYDFDESLLKPYLSLKNVREALFAVSGNLFGLKYKKRNDIPLYHPDVDIYEVTEETSDGTGEERLVSIFLHDNFARPFKASGAWMSEYRSQTKNLNSTSSLPTSTSVSSIEGIPIVSNNNNFAKSDQVTLLSYDDARTLFHEFGHAHHGMLSDATYGRLASTNVLTDFVELPSQLMEHWFEQRDVIKKYAQHYKTSEQVPDDLLDKLDAAKSFQQGFQTIEYSACALLDMALHQISDYNDFDLQEFEQNELNRLGMPQGIVMRHRPAHFQHLFSTNAYAAGYYVYQWAEVLDADAFAAFKETGDIFDPDTALRARKYIYSAGNTIPPDELFRKFRGRDPDINFMLRKKGLIDSK